MHCEQVEMLLAQWCFGEIDTDTDAGREIQTHLDGCDACKEKLGDMRVTANLLVEAFEASPVPRLSDNRRTALFTAIAEEDAEALAKTANRAPQRKIKSQPAPNPFLMFLAQHALKGMALVVILVLMLGLSVTLLPSLDKSRGDYAMNATDESEAYFSDEPAATLDKKAYDNPGLNAKWANAPEVELQASQQQSREADRNTFGLNGAAQQTTKTTTATENYRRKADTFSDADDGVARGGRAAPKPDAKPQTLSGLGVSGGAGGGKIAPGAAKAPAERGAAARPYGGIVANKATSEGLEKSKSDALRSRNNAPMGACLYRNCGQGRTGYPQGLTGHGPEIARRPSRHSIRLQTKLNSRTAQESNRRPARTTAERTTGCSR